MSQFAHRQRDVTLSLLALILVTAAAWTKVLVITAVPIGLLFGFFLQKGDLCGASAFSEVVLTRDWRKVFGVGTVLAAGFVAITPAWMIARQTRRGERIREAGKLTAKGLLTRTWRSWQAGLAIGLLAVPA